MEDKRLLRRAVAWAAANWLLDAASLWVFVAAFGHVISPIDLLTAYGLANILAAIPITPGGLGVVEFVLVSMLAGFGLTDGQALSAVLAYRAVNFWLPIPFGGLAYAPRTRTQGHRPPPPPLCGPGPGRNGRGRALANAGRVRERTVRMVSGRITRPGGSGAATTTTSPIAVAGPRMAAAAGGLSGSPLTADRPVVAGLPAAAPPPAGSAGPGFEALARAGRLSATPQCCRAPALGTDPAG